MNITGHHLLHESQKMEGWAPHFWDNSKCSWHHSSAKNVSCLFVSITSYISNIIVSHIHYLKSNHLNKVATSITLYHNGSSHTRHQWRFVCFKCIERCVNYLVEYNLRNVWTGQICLTEANNTCKRTPDSTGLAWDKGYFSNHLDTI